MGVHDVHRERLRWRFIEHGLKNFNELNSLELLLFFAIPRRDTNELAHTLLARFGTLAGVFDASYEELTSVPGVGENAAALIMLVPQILKKSYVARGEETAYITNSTEAGKYLVPRFMFEKDEIALILCLDTQKRVLSCTEIGRGVVNAVNASPRKVVETALKKRASAVILAHNHPDGFAIPSREDDIATKQIYSSLELVGIPLVDHIIVAGEDFVSYADSGMLTMYKY